jgi:hypothetical protein
VILYKISLIGLILCMHMQDRLIQSTSIAFFDLEKGETNCFQSCRINSKSFLSKSKFKSFVCSSMVFKPFKPSKYDIDISTLGSGFSRSEILVFIEFPHICHTEITRGGRIRNAFEKGRLEIVVKTKLCFPSICYGSSCDEIFYIITPFYHFLFFGN